MVCLAGIEIYLRFFYQDNCDPPRFIPYHYRKLNETINEKNKAAAKKHPHGFRDEIWPLTKDPGVFRLAVLGDSFIWGDGLPYEQIWSQKLKQRLNEAYGGRVEVLSWGRKGWSTLDEYRFLKDLGINYQPDLLIVGYVSNDPDLGLYPQEYFNLAQVSVVRPLRWLFPNTVYFVSILCEWWANKFFALGYANWEEKLYHPENLQEYGRLLLEFSHFCLRHHITLLLVHTPPNYHPSYREKFAQVAPLLKKAGIPYLDLYPAVARDLGRYPYYQLWANPANPHPGPLVTEVYAREVFDYLKQNHLRHLPLSRP